MKKETAVEWLHKESAGLINKYLNKEISERDFLTTHHNMYYQAIRMERDQIYAARQDGHDDTYNTCDSGCSGREELESTHEKYYNQTYNL